MNREIIIAKLTFSKFHILEKNGYDDIRNKIYLELIDYYKQLIFKYHLNKIFNSLNFFGRFYSIKKEKLIYRDHITGQIKFNN